ncbi:MAG: response regulator [Gammaproteobacteria bacterium]|nr:response regulator [Gammaproteobacteria bacterium]
MSVSAPADVLLGPGQRLPQTSDSVAFSVAAIGLSARDKHTLQAVFAVSQGRRPRLEPFVFAPGRCADLFVVNADEPGGLNAWRAYRRAHPDRAHTPVLFVGHNRPADLQGLFLPRPLIVMRMLALLERVVVDVLGYVPTLAIDETEGDQVAGEARANGHGAGIRALVVDDSLPVRVQLKRALEGIAERLDFAESAEQALTLLADNHYDIAFVDIVLPGLDGYELCERIKQDPDIDETSVVMLTGNSSPADRIRGELAGCDTYLIKPVRRRVFENVVGELLPAHRRGRLRPALRAPVANAARVELPADADGMGSTGQERQA